MGILNKIFYKVGSGVANHPFIVFFGCALATLV